MVLVIRVPPNRALSDCEINTHPFRIDWCKFDLIRVVQALEASAFSK